MPYGPLLPRPEPDEVRPLRASLLTIPTPFKLLTGGLIGVLLLGPLEDLGANVEYEGRIGDGPYLPYFFILALFCVWISFRLISYAIQPRAAFTTAIQWTVGLGMAFLLLVGMGMWWSFSAHLIQGLEGVDDLTKLTGDSVRSAWLVRGAVIAGPIALIIAATWNVWFSERYLPDPRTYTDHWRSLKAQEGEVWFTEVEFEEGGGSKDRPVLIVGPGETPGTWATMMFTSQDKTGRERWYHRSATVIHGQQKSWLKMDRVIVVNDAALRSFGGGADRETWTAAYESLPPEHISPWRSDKVLLAG